MLNIPKNQKILFFCAHPDDDTLSSGALIYSLMKNNNKIASIYLTSSPRGVARDISTEEKIRIRKTEAINAYKILGIKPVFLDLDKPTLKYSKENVNIIKKLLKKRKTRYYFPSTKK